MDFVAVVDQVIALLRQRGRVTYRTLQLQFTLDDEQLAVLKDELIYSQPHVVDDAGRGLVWTGESALILPIATTIPQAAAQPAPPPTVPPPPDAERRQLTVLFCDLVDSTVLSGQLDPEDLREVVQAYQETCTKVIARFEGYIAQYLGDGLLVYFGYPLAHEDDAQRAVRAGLDMLAAMGDLKSRLAQDKGIGVAVRLGIHTGLVVVGEMGGQGRQEQLALGHVPNVCARLQGLAAPNTIALSEATYRLVQGYFECQALGEQTLRGVAQPLQVYRVLQESGARGRLDVAGTRGLTPLIGRDSEVTLLLERWEQATRGQGQVVLLTGDAGIGKSRLVHMLKDHVANASHVRWECRSAEYAQNTALFPLTDLFQRLLQFETGDTPDEKFTKLEQTLHQYRLPREDTVPLFAPFLALPLPAPHYAPLNLSPQRQRQKTLETLVAILLELAERQPVLCIIEDLHWTDPTTLEWLHLVIEQIPTTSICAVLTCRSTFQPPWPHRSYMTEITLHRLPPPQIERMVERVAGGKTLPDQVMHLLIEKTDGVPLVIEELTKAMLESGALKETDGQYALAGVLSAFAIPATLQDSLMARLDRLVTAKGVAQLGATIGRQFAYKLLQAVSQLDALTLQRELRRLVEAEIVYQRGVPPHATYVFKHALIQDAAYASLLKSTRQQYHQRIAHVLEAQFPAVVETHPELLAHHYTEAGDAAQAMRYWQQAGKRALERSAHREAIAHLTQGLALFKTLPDAPARLEQELDFQTTLGVALMATKGYAAPEVAHAYARARELCRHMGDTPQLFRVLWGLRLFYLLRAEFGTTRELGEQLLRLAQRVQDASLLLIAHSGVGDLWFHVGELTAARPYLEQAVTRYDRQQHRALAFLSSGVDPGVASHCFLALTLWFLGYPAQAGEHIHQALALSQALSHPHSRVFTLFFTAWLHQWRREGHATQEWAEAVITLAAEQGFAYWATQGTILRGWVLAAHGHEEDGIRQMGQGLADRQATGTELARPYFLGLLAEAYGQEGQVGEGLAVLAEALTAIDNTGERLYEAELQRLTGALLLKQAVADETHAEAHFHQALDVARHQQAKSLELRAAVSLSRLWQQQGKRAEARELLAPVYDWFTEGFDTADLQEAKVLLEELGG